MSKPQESKADILVVDDQLINLKVIKTMLSKNGYWVRPALSGALALQAAQKSLPDLILLDVMMPDMDGYEVCRKLKADTRTQDIPIIFISALGKTRDKIKAFSLGGVDYVTKPFNEEEILARLEIHLALRNMQRELENKNVHLEQEIAERRQAEKELREYRQHLEELVAERTAALERTNSQLRQEIVERRQTERALRHSEGRYRQLAQENEYLLEQARRDAEAKTILLNEVDHRVKNNISAVIGLLLTEQRYAAARNQRAYQSCLNRLISRIQGLSKVHQLLSLAGWAPILLSELVLQIGNAAVQAVPFPKRVSINVSPTDIRITSEKASSLALVINELVTNSLKHALSAGAALEIDIDITLETNHQKQPPTVLLRLKDNGPGYPEAMLQDDHQQEELGLYLIRNLVTRDLLGELQLSNDSGAVTTIRLKTSSILTIPAHTAERAATPLHVASQAS